MLLFLFWSPLFVLLPKYISCKTLCEDTIIVNGTEKEDVILQVDKSINIINIVWSAREDYLVKTSPNGQIDFQGNKLKNKLQSEHDASLKFLFVTEEDQRTYTANILLSDETTCKQRFDLRVYKKLSTEDIMINISKNIRNDTCNINLTCSVNGSDVSVTWSSSRNTRKYEAKILLHIRNVENENYTCTAENPVSKASRTVSPSEYCNKVCKHMYFRNVLLPVMQAETKSTPLDFPVLNIIRLVLSACIFILGSFIFLHHMKNEHNKPSADNRRTKKMEVINYNQ